MYMKMQVNIWKSLLQNGCPFIHEAVFALRLLYMFVSRVTYVIAKFSNSKIVKCITQH